MRVSTSLVNHPKVKRLIRVLGFESFYSLISLWSYAATNKPDGDLTGLDDIDIAIASNWDGDEKLFLDTLCQMGFLECNDNSILIHDWVEHNPYAAGSTDRSEKSRFSKMKSHYPEIYKTLYNKGVRQISSREYQRVVNESLTTVERPLNVPSSPLPVPTPSPIPSPIPTEGKKSEYSDKFESFWKEYPNKSGKSKAYSSWKRFKCESEIYEEIMKALSHQKKSVGWTKDNGKFIPMGSTWVNGKRWEDATEQTSSSRWEGE